MSRACVLFLQSDTDMEFDIWMDLRYSMSMNLEYVYLELSNRSIDKFWEFNIFGYKFSAH